MPCDLLSTVTVRGVQSSMLFTRSHKNDCFRGELAGPSEQTAYDGFSRADAPPLSAYSVWVDERMQSGQRREVKSARGPDLVDRTLKTSMISSFLTWWTGFDSSEASWASECWASRERAACSSAFVVFSAHVSACARTVVCEGEEVLDMELVLCGAGLGVCVLLFLSGLWAADKPKKLPTGETRHVQRFIAVLTDLREETLRCCHRCPDCNKLSLWTHGIQLVQVAAALA